MSTVNKDRTAAGTPEALHALLADAFNEGDIDALVEAYDEDAVLVVPPAGRSVRGRDNIRAATAPLLALGPYFTSVVQKTVQTDGWALTYARWELVGATADGRPVRLSGRGTMVSRRRPDGTWGILLDDPLSPGFP
jgi:ketosteroid isomerase-like protein